MSINVPCDQAGCYTNENGTYREDCSGFVWMAWGLAHPIALADLQPGDLLLNLSQG